MDQGFVENDASCEYRSPFSSRYASKEMQYNFSDKKKFSTWRKLWTYLAKAEKGVKLFKPIVHFQFQDAKAAGKVKPLVERGSKYSQQILVPQQPHAQSDLYQDVWLQKQATKPEPYLWSTDALQMNSLNQSPSSCNEWNSVGPSMRRPLTRQSSLDHGSKSSFSQGSEYFHSGLYQQLVKSSRQNVKKSLDSSLYSDPDCHRPLSSDSSSGSVHSSFSMSAGSCVSNWDGGTNSSGSAANWDHTLSNDTEPDVGSGLLMRTDFFTPDTRTQSSMWHLNEQQRYFPTDLNKGGIWSSCFKSQEDYELIDDLFMKENGSLDVKNNDQGMNLSLHSLALTNDSTKKPFDRTIQPPQPRYIVSQRASLNATNFRKVY